MSSSAEPVQDKIRQSITENALLSWDYVAMNVLATVIASYGLLADNAAVVIGGMVIATLLGPILGIAMALVEGRRRCLAKRC